MTYICCHLPPFLSCLNRFIPWVNLYDARIHNPRRLVFFTCSPLRSQVKDANNIILSLTETSNWYAYWMLSLFSVRFSICSAAISMFDAVYGFNAYIAITGHGFLLSTICSLLGLASPRRVCCRQRSIAHITCFSYAFPWAILALFSFCQGMWQDEPHIFRFLVSFESGCMIYSDHLDLCCLC